MNNKTDQELAKETFQKWWKTETGLPLESFILEAITQAKAGLAVESTCGELSCEECDRHKATLRAQLAEVTKERDKWQKEYVDTGFRMESVSKDRSELFQKVLHLEQSIATANAVNTRLNTELLAEKQAVADAKQELVDYRSTLKPVIEDKDKSIRAVNDQLTKANELLRDAAKEMERAKKLFRACGFTMEGTISTPYQNVLTEIETYINT